jgi:hypothetical protein
MNIGIIGTGKMGGTLGKLWIAKGHKIFFGSRNPQKAKALAQSINLDTDGGNIVEAAKFGEVILLAIPWRAAETIKAVGPLEGKILIDCTNPPASEFANRATGRTTSAAEEIAQWLPGTRVIKAFNSIFWQMLSNPQFGSQKVSLFYCGDDDAAKEVVARLAEEIGFEPIDSGSLANARYLESLAFLWMDLALGRGMGTDIAFKLIRR